MSRRLRLFLVGLLLASPAALLASPVDSRPRRGPVLSGHVLDKDSGQPIAGAELTFVANEGRFIVNVESVAEASVSSDAQGAFQVGELSPRLYGLIVSAPGHSRKYTSVQVPRPEHLTLELERTGRLEGQVVDSAGAPVPGAELWTRHLGGLAADPLPRTDAQGRFCVDVDSGAYSLGAKASGVAGLYEGKVTVARGGRARGLLIRVRPAGSLSGKAFLRSSQEPLVDALVEAHHADSGWRHRSRLDASGGFLLEGLLPGRYSLRLSRPGQPELTRGELLVEPGQRLTVEFALERWATLEGNMTDALGRPLEEVHVQAVPLGRSELEPQWLGRTSDEKGHYLFKMLPPGSYRLEARHAIGTPSFSRELTLREGEVARADFAFPVARGEVRGVAQRPGGGPPRHQSMVIATLGEHSNPEMAFPDDSGRFSLKLLPGTYRLSASYVDLFDEAPGRTVTVRAGKVSQVRLTLPDSGVETRGLVLNSWGEPAADASVVFESDELTLRESTDPRGRFLLKASRKKTGLIGTLRVECDEETAELRGVRLGSTGTVVRLVKAAAL
ncbi:carboxypeptidase regulatory-like domain-containing protein [Hyalangium gracile]|uniref:carboxypeptidase regulatory-like domain-containing protein n=1 Tax=Hyalangium gracile TaxID=394092 RepID=UPI001CCF3344|nr:carboxypeptidase regulatory-like domain-containing protein [Hyalangium gracile]